MKSILLAVLSTISLSMSCSQEPSASNLTDRGGRDNSGGARGGRVDSERGTQAWFLTESSEQVLRNAQTNGTSGAEALSVQIKNGTAAQVAVTSDRGIESTDCRMFQESSQRGTVTKWEVGCGGSQIENRNVLARGTALWLLGEGLEHSARLWLASDATVSGKLVSGNSDILNETTVLVSLKTQDGIEKSFSCVNGLGGRNNDRADLNCTAL